MHTDIGQRGRPVRFVPAQIVPGETGEEVHHALLRRHRFVDLAGAVQQTGNVGQGAADVLLVRLRIVGCQLLEKLGPPPRRPQRLLRAPQFVQVVAVPGVQPGAFVPVRRRRDPGREQPDADGGPSHHEVRGGRVRHGVHHVLQERRRDVGQFGQSGERSAPGSHAEAGIGG